MTDEELLSKQAILTIGNLKLIMPTGEALQIANAITKVKRSKKANEWFNGGSHEVIKPMDDSDVTITPANEAEILILQNKYEEYKGKK